MHLIFIYEKKEGALSTETAGGGRQPNPFYLRFFQWQTQCFTTEGFLIGNFTCRCVLFLSWTYIGPGNLEKTTYGKSQMNYEQ